MSGQRFRPSRKLGQNFLTDPAIARRIVEAASARSGQLVLEVGPGRGILTQALLDTGARVLAVEKDYRLYQGLRERFAAAQAIEIERADILKFDVGRALGERLEGGARAQVVANLPYSVASPTLFYLIESAARLSRITVMLQKEMAERICAGPGSRTYGSISAAIALHGRARLAFGVPAGAFRPRPRVDSALVDIDLAPLGEPAALALAGQVVRAAFTRRRKYLRNSLLESRLLAKKGQLVDNALDAAGIDPACRAESLGPAEFLRLALALAEAGAPGGPPESG